MCINPRKSAHPEIGDTPPFPLDARAVATPATVFCGHAASLSRFNLTVWRESGRKAY